MAITYGFYNAIDHDRQYDAVQMSSIFDGIINDGIYMSIGDAFKVSIDSGLTVNVGSGRAWFNHTWTLNDAVYKITLDAAEMLTSRIDAIVLEVDSSDAVRANAIKVVKGTASTKPVNPTLTNNDTLHQYPLAYISVAAGATTLSASDITSKIGSTETPYVTGPLTTISNDDIISKWEDEFETWFKNLKYQLDGDVATKLQSQINRIYDFNTINYITDGSPVNIDSLENGLWGIEISYMSVTGTLPTNYNSDNIDTLIVMSWKDHMQILYCASGSSIIKRYIRFMGSVADEYGDWIGSHIITDDLYDNYISELPTRFGSVKRMSAGSKVVNFQNNQSIAFKSANELSKELGVKDSDIGGDTTAIFICNGHYDANNAAMIDCFWHQNTRTFHARADRQTGTARVNYLAVYFGDQ